LFFLSTEKAIYITSYPLDNELIEKMVPNKVTSKLAKRPTVVKSSSSSASSAQDKRITQLPVFKFNASRKEKQSSSKETWTLKPTMARRKVTSRRATKPTRKRSLSKRSFTRRKPKNKNIVLKNIVQKSDGDSIKSSTSLPSTDNLTNVLPKIYPPRKSTVQKNRLNVEDPHVYLSAEEKWSSSRLTPIERIKRDDELRRVNSNLEYFMPALLRNYNM